jgi:competence CoiA-like predicted nuclease
MLYAVRGGEKVKARPEQRGTCPNCNHEVIAKCGEINIWHWAHLPSVECDSWAECESAWHLLWKSYFPPEFVEVPIIKGGKRHVADIRTRSGLIIELQASSLSVEEIREREQFYTNMLWVFDVNEPMRDGRLKIRDKGEYQTFRWYNPRKHIAYTTKPRWLDLGDGSLFKLKLMSQQCPCGGWGYVKNRDMQIRAWHN